jgi:hypothetical protein
MSDKMGFNEQREHENPRRKQRGLRGTKNRSK